MIIITSDMNLKQITLIMHMFNEKSLFIKKHSNVFSSRVIVITTVKLNMKINLQFQCRTHIQFDHEWRKKNEKQTTERVFRIEQKKLIKSYVLYTNKTIEGRIHILQRNREIILMKTIYDKSKLEESENLLFNKKNHEKKAKKYI